MCSPNVPRAAKKRAWSGVISTPPASSTRRTAPAAAGARLNAINPDGISQSAGRNEVMVGRILLGSVRLVELSPRAAV
jgi:hypothetical protein